MGVEIITAKSAGMCYGVKRALKMAEELAEGEGRGQTLGELINNNDEVERLSKMGIVPIKSLEEYTPGQTVIIRSHGVGRDIYDRLSKMGAYYIDATCPNVKKIQDMVYEETEKGGTVLLIGDEFHPEIVGIVGHKSENGECFVFEDYEKVKNWLQSENLYSKNALILLSQTTYDSKKWLNCKENVKKHYTNVRIFDTICNATTKRQEEAESLAEVCDVMLVIGARHSSNSKKLADICMGKTKTYFIENAGSFNFNSIHKLLNKKNVKIGITAGASTPAYIIKEVHSTMNEEVKKGLVNRQDMTEGDLDFLAEIDKTFKRIYIGNRVKAYVVSVNKTEAIVDVGTKHSGYIPADELTNDSSKMPSDIVSVGDEIDCIVTQINDAEGVVYLSKKRVDAALGLEKIAKAAESGDAITGVVSSVVKGGIIVISEGARVFIPASQTGVPKTGKLEELLKKTINFKIIEVNEARGRIVGSIRAARKEIDDAVKQKFWAEIEEGKKYTGEVKSIESYGVFVDLGGVDGMVHLSELTWNRIKHPKEVVAIGDKLDVYVKNFDKEKRRVSLGAKDSNDNPWTKFNSEFAVGDVVKAQVVSITPFGAFAQIIPGVDGLIHISQIALERVSNVNEVLAVGQVVEAKITEIEVEKNRVSLSIKALLEPAVTENAEAAEETSELVYSDDNPTEIAETEETAE